jgi:hypothetical protein
VHNGSSKIKGFPYVEMSDGEGCYRVGWG